MRLAINLIHAGRYFREGDDVDKSLVPANLRKLNERLRAQREEADWGDSKPAPHPPTRAKANAKPPPGQRYVRRKFGFQRMDGQTLVAGEKLYKREGNAFVRVGRVPSEKAH